MWLNCRESVRYETLRYSFYLLSVLHSPVNTTTIVCFYAINICQHGYRFDWLDSTRHSEWVSESWNNYTQVILFINITLWAFEWYIWLPTMVSHLQIVVTIPTNSVCHSCLQLVLYMWVKYDACQQNILLWRLFRMWGCLDRMHTALEDEPIMPTLLAVAKIWRNGQK